MARVGQVLDIAHRHRALARIDGLEPRRSIAPRNPRQQLLQHLGQIAHQRNIHLDVLVDLRGIDFDMNLLRLQRVGARRPNHAIVKAHAARDQKIGFLDRMIHPRLAVHAHHAQVQRMRSREAAQPQQRQRHWNLRPLCQRLQLLHRAGLHHAVSRKNHRPLRIANQIHRILQAALFHAQHRMRPIRRRLRRVKIEQRCRLLRILRNVNQHRPRPARPRNLERVPQAPAPAPQPCSPGSCASSPAASRP